MTHERLMPILDKACRYIASHSQPPETQGIRPTPAELKVDYDAVLNSASWNHIAPWLKRLDALRFAA